MNQSSLMCMGNMELPDCEENYVPPTNDLTFSLESFTKEGWNPSHSVWIDSDAPRSLPRRVTMTLHADFAEIKCAVTKRSCQQWPLHNIVSWGHNVQAVALVVVGQELVDHELTRWRHTHNFKTTEGASICQSLKNLTDNIARLTPRASLLATADVPSSTVGI